MAEYIERQALRNAHIYLNEEGVAVIEIEDIPAADVQPVKHGRWIEDVDGCVICSECSNPAEINGITGEFMESPYCSECGAKMREENE